MIGVYRTSGFPCPSCPNGALREFQNRLVCDECSGMLIEADDFTASIHEIDGSHDLLVFSDEAPATPHCPRCSHPMTSCSLALGALAFPGTFVRCAAHGIWIPRDAMAAVYARVSRRGGFRGLGTSGGSSDHGRGGASSTSSMIANMPSGHGGMSGAIASIANAFGGSAGSARGLAISDWQARRPRAHTLFVSAHKDLRMACPSCREAPLGYHGDRWDCATCAGSFVENAALAAMVMEMSQQPWDVPVASGTPADRACPICKTPMLVEVLEAVTIDRCTTHGVWFDDTELQTALHHANPEPMSVGAWLKRLFHRHGTTA